MTQFKAIKWSLQFALVLVAVGDFGKARAVEDLGGPTVTSRPPCIEEYRYPVELQTQVGECTPASTLESGGGYRAESSLMLRHHSRRLLVLQDTCKKEVIGSSYETDIRTETIYFRDPEHGTVYGSISGAQQFGEPTAYGKCVASRPSFLFVAPTKVSGQGVGNNQAEPVSRTSKKQKRKP